MIRKILLLLFALTSLMANAQIDKILGRWITVDDKSGIEKSIVLIFKATDGKYYGRIEKLLEEKYAGALCIPCEGADHNKPVEGLTIIRGMTLEDGVLKGGKVLAGIVQPETAVGQSEHAALVRIRSGQQRGPGRRTGRTAVERLPEERPLPGECRKIRGIHGKAAGRNATSGVVGVQIDDVFHASRSVVQAPAMRGIGIGSVSIRACRNSPRVRQCCWSVVMNRMFFAEGDFSINAHFPQQCLYFLPLPQGQGSLRPGAPAARRSPEASCSNRSMVWE